MSRWPRSASARAETLPECDPPRTTFGAPISTRMSWRIGDTFRVPDRDDLVLMTGNAGAIDIIVDGRRLGPLGPNGEVRRNVPLTAEALTRIAQSRGG